MCIESNKDPDKYFRIIKTEKNRENSFINKINKIQCSMKDYIIMSIADLATITELSKLVIYRSQSSGITSSFNYTKNNPLYPPTSYDQIYTGIQTPLQQPSSPSHR